MFAIRFDGPDTIRLEGRLDASAEVEAATFLDSLERSVVLDFTELKYIASNGLGILFAAHKRLLENGERMRLVNLNSHIEYVFELAGFDTIFEIE